MVRYAQSPDAESFARALAALDGSRFARDARSSKVLRLMLARSDGCDADLTAAHFVIRFATDSRRAHPYFQHTAPAVISTIMELSRSPPGTRTIRTEIRGGEISTGTDSWRFDRRRLWLDASATQVVIQVRSGDQDAGDRAEPLPAPGEPPVEDVDYASSDEPKACPHCAQRSRTYRRLSGGRLVCAACGRSFPPG